MKIAYISDNKQTQIQKDVLIKFIGWEGFGVEEIHCLEIEIPPTDIKVISYEVDGTQETDYQNYKDMVNNTFALFATPNSYNDDKSDIWKVVNYALVKGKLVYVIFPDGSYRKWRAG